MKIYGTKTCPDCAEVVKRIRTGVGAEFVDILESRENLKEFLHVRDKESCFEIVRQNGGIGIPCFVSDTGEVTLDMGKGMALLNQQIEKGDTEL